MNLSIEWVQFLVQAGYSAVHWSQVRDPRAPDSTIMRGDVVGIRDSEGQEFARGLTNYSTADANEIRGLRTVQARLLLGRGLYDEVIHKDNLVLTL